MIELSIKVNGEDVRLTDFPREIITNLILAILKSLKDVDEDVNNVVIELKAK